MAIAVVIALGIGLSVFEKDRLAQPVLTVSGIILTIPSYAAFAFLMPFTGLGFTSAVIVLIAYAQLPILRNTIIGLREIDPAIVESGVGMGMGRGQLLFKVQLPMALPVIMAGIRVSMVMIVGIAAIAAVIRAGGLGVFIFRGIARTSNDLVLMGASRQSWLRRKVWGDKIAHVAASIKCPIMFANLSSGKLQFNISSFMQFFWDTEDDIQ